MAAKINICFCFLVTLCLVGCKSSSVKIFNGVIPDVENCRPKSSTDTEVAKSQLSCHQGISGDGRHVLISNTTTRFAVHSDSKERELVSIFFRPYGASLKPGPVEFDAYYSQGLFELRGKNGCVGILETGQAEIRNSGKKSVLSYSLEFRLVSPLGWKEDCKEPYRVSGSVDL